MVTFKNGYMVFVIPEINMIIFSYVSEIRDRELYKRINRNSYHSYYNYKKENEYVFYCYQVCGVEYYCLRYVRIYYEEENRDQERNEQTNYVVQFDDGISRLCRRVVNGVILYYCVHYYEIYLEDRKVVENIIGKKISNRKYMNIKLMSLKNTINILS
jgi:hypothetical protein